MQATSLREQPSFEHHVEWCLSRLSLRSGLIDSHSFPFLSYRLRWFWLPKGAKPRKEQ